MNRRATATFHGLAAAAGMLLALVSQAATPSSLILTVDNDYLFPPSNKDWNYTAGTTLSWSDRQVAKLGLTAPTRLLDDWLLGWSGAPARFTNEQHTVIGGGLAYTPHDISNPDPIPNDRPYASLVFISSRIRRLDDAQEPTRTLSTELSVGMLGLEVASNIQKKVHDISSVDTSPEPMGWSHQISDGGEPTLEYRVAADTLLVRKSSEPDCDWLQASAGGEVGVGYNTYVWAGGLIKLGWMGKDYGAPGSIIDPLAGLAAGPNGGASGARECYAFTRAGGYAVAYNALLQGQFKHSDVTYPWSGVEHFVGELQLGLVFRLSHLSLTYAVTCRSAEFKSDLAATHYFGTATAAWSWDF